MPNYDLYAKGTNIIDSKTNILSIFNFNSLHPNQLSSPLINANYNDSAIKI